MVYYRDTLVLALQEMQVVDMMSTHQYSNGTRVIMYLRRLDAVSL